MILIYNLRVISQEEHLHCQNNFKNKGQVKVAICGNKNKDSDLNVEHIYMPVCAHSHRSSNYWMQSKSLFHVYCHVQGQFIPQSGSVIIFFFAFDMFID